MEQSKLSKIIAILKVAYPYHFEKMNDEEFAGLVSLYQQQINYDPVIVARAVNEIIKNSKFMPTIAEIIEECEKQVGRHEFKILEVMSKYGYFKIPLEYEKATRYLETGNIPSWFLEDMKKYGYTDLRNTTITHKECVGITTAEKGGKNE